MNAVIDQPSPVQARLQQPVSAAEFTRRSDLGLYEGLQVCLIDGEVLEMPSPSPEHDYCVTIIDLFLRQVFQSNHFIRLGTGLPIRADSNPCPDLAVIKGHPADFRKSPPKTAVLVVEVSNTTLTIDLNRKATLYAEANIPEYWVLDITGRKLIVHRQPSQDENGFQYQSITTLSETEKIAPLQSPESFLAVVDMLP